MAGQPITLAGVKVGICTTPQNSDLTDVSPGGFGSLNYVDVANVGNIGAYGYSTNMVNYDTMDRPISLKAKGVTDGGSLSIQVANSAGDAGQAAMRTAADPTKQDNYAVKIEYADGTIHYLRGAIGGPSHPGGGPESFFINEYTLGVNEILEVDPTP